MNDESVIPTLTAIDSRVDNYRLSTKNGDITYTVNQNNDDVSKDLKGWIKQVYGDNTGASIPGEYGILERKLRNIEFQVIATHSRCPSIRWVFDMDTEQFGIVPPILSEIVSFNGSASQTLISEREEHDEMLESDEIYIPDKFRVSLQYLTPLSSTERGVWRTDYDLPFKLVHNRKGVEWDSSVEQFKEVIDAFRTDTTDVINHIHHEEHGGPTQIGDLRGDITEVKHEEGSVEIPCKVFGRFNPDLFDVLSVASRQFDRSSLRRQKTSEKTQNAPVIET